MFFLAFLLVYGKIRDPYKYSNTDPGGPKLMDTTDPEF